MASRSIRIGDMDWEIAARRVAGAIEPVGGSPDAALSGAAFLGSYGTSLMPRSSMHQGVVTGLSLIGARSTSSVVERTVRRLARGTSPTAIMSTRAVLGLAAGVATQAAGRGDTGGSLRRSSVGAVSSVVAAATIGGTLYDARRLWRGRHPAGSGMGALAVSVAAAAVPIVATGARLRRRQSEIERWPVRQVASQAPATAIGIGVATVGAGLAKSAGVTNRALRGLLGPGPASSGSALAANTVGWSGAAIAGYAAIVRATAKSNEKVEDVYASAPVSSLRSGSAESLSSYDDLGLQGRRFVNDALDAERIEDVMRGGDALEPIRVFVGYNSEPLYPTGRAELALQELERTGAFERSHLLLVSPTGTGWVDHTMMWAAELLARGDIATCCVQYGRSPSFLAAHQVPLGRSQFRLLLWGVRQRLMAVPVAQRPKVLVFGESLGAWTASDVVMHQGISGFDHYGIDKALWVGLPGLAKWSRNGMAKGASDLVPDGTVAVVDRPEELEAMSADERESLRATILSHVNDPIAHLSAEIMVQEPDFLTSETRGRGVPESMRFRPFLTFAHTLGDAMNAMVNTAGEFGSFGHDYRADTARVVRDAYGFGANADQMERVESALRQLELDRDHRLKSIDDDDLATDARTSADD